MSNVIRTSGRVARATLIGIGLIGALVGVRILALGDSQQAQSIVGVNVADPTFAIGPIDGLTTSWYMAPPVTSIPLGTVAYFHQACPPEAVVIWTGADEVDRDAQGSTAMSLLLQPGAHIVSVWVLPAHLGAAEIASQCRLNVQDISVDQITVSPIEALVDPVEIDEGLPPDELNEVTMEYFFGLSIAAMRDLGNGQYRTSVDRLIHMAVEVDPPGFAPLMEWRIDGHAREIGASTTTWFTDIGNHVAEVGPLLNPAEIEIETYSVTITSHTSGEDIIEEGELIVFIAETDPPGYENEITWLSSTMYGTAEPILGEGAIFIAEFNDTWGLDENGGPFQWLGVKADNAAFNQDRKRCELVALNTPTGVLQNCVLVPVGAGLFDLELTFTMNAVFQNRCECCEYRQCIKGSMTVSSDDHPEGVRIRPRLGPGSVLSAAIYKEDCVFPAPAVANIYYGHRNEPANGLPVTWDEYTNPFNRPIGCVYNGQDKPKLRNLRSGDIGHFELFFKGRIIDTCQGPEHSCSDQQGVIAEREWSVLCQGAVPLEGPPELVIEVIVELELAGLPVTVSFQVFDDNILAVAISVPSPLDGPGIDSSEVSLSIPALTEIGSPEPGPLLETRLRGVTAHAIYHFDYPPGSPQVLTVEVSYSDDTANFVVDLSE